jgi:hypothetical protein
MKPSKQIINVSLSSLQVLGSGKAMEQKFAM